MDDIVDRLRDHQNGGRRAECEEAANQIEALRDMLDSARADLEMLREALGVPAEPHQSLIDRMVEAAQAKRGAVPEGWREDVYLAAQMLTWADDDGGLTDQQDRAIRAHQKKMFAMLAAAAAVPAPAEVLMPKPVAYGFGNTAITGHTNRLMMVRLDVPLDDQYAGAFWLPLVLADEAHTYGVACRAAGEAAGYVRGLRDAVRDAAPLVQNGEVLVTVTGLTGSGKSAIAGEIEIMCRALGLEVEWGEGAAEKHLTHADWTNALEMYRPRVRIVEANIPRTDAALAKWKESK